MKLETSVSSTAVSSTKQSGLWKLPTAISGIVDETTATIQYRDILMGSRSAFRFIKADVKGGSSGTVCVALGNDAKKTYLAGDGSLSW